MYDVIIVGSGPAGLFAAYELSKTNKKILVIAKGKDINKRDNILSGVGGAGLYSDGKLNLSPVHGKTNLFKFMSRKKAYELINNINKILVNFGAPKEYYPKNIKQAIELRKRAKKAKLHLIVRQAYFLLQT